MRWRAVPAALAGLALVGVAVPVEAAAPGCANQPAPGAVSAATPPEVQAFDPKRLARWATGRGVRVAVIDSGVDGKHPQLAGRVEAGKDFLHGGSSGRQDCVGHGTGVASIIAAAPVAGTGFQGLAPEAVIVPVRLSEQQVIEGKAVGKPGSVAQFAQAIRWAAGEGRADVINISLVMTEPDDEVRAAVADAIEDGVVVVAAAGNQDQQGNPTPYPAAYPGVLGVGALSPDGVRASFSQRGEYVDLVAPGEQVTVAAPGRGHVLNQGTSFAAPFVAGAAALLRQRFPRASPGEIGRRLMTSADPAPAGVRSGAYGFGALNPYRALTEAMGPETAPAVAAQPVRTADPAVAAYERRRQQARERALWFAGVGTALVVTLAVVAVVARRGRGRGWRPAGV